MPELPEVETIRTALERAICNTNIIRTIINNNNLREKIPEDFANIISGTKIISCGRRAKYLLLGLDSGYSIIWHLGMSGKVIISSERPNPQKHDHVLIETDKVWLAYNDPRRFGLITYCKTDEIGQHRFFKNMGPEPFSDGFNAAYLLNKFKNKSIPVKTAILDQGIVTGVGNIYASESLFFAGISPLRPANSLSREECSRLIAKISDVLKNAIAAGGSTLKDYQKPDGSLGYFQNLHCVYNKTGQKCPGCTCDISQTGGIAKIVQSGRSSFYCPVKQK